MPSIAILGASTNWVPAIVTDLQAVFEEPLEIRIIDTNRRAADLGAEWCEAATKRRERKDRVTATTHRREGLAGADAVVITLHVGGLDAMERDVKIPERYGIFATVGDTTGPSGWSRALRNLPVFRDFARDFQEVCPSAFIANYSNPLAALTAAIQLSCGNPGTGLCHSYFETKDFIQKLFGLADWRPISLALAGMNHFTWVVGFRIGKEDGYELLREKLAGRSLRALLDAEEMRARNIHAGSQLCAELYDATGYLPYPGDRHISEFVSFALAGNVERHTITLKDGESIEATRYCDIKRTSIEQRRAAMPSREARIRAQISGETPLPKKSRETGAEMIHAYIYNKPMTDAVNVLNQGQVPGLPPGACVETFGMVDGYGVRPVLVPDVPEPLLEIMRPQAICQKWLTEGVLKGDRELALQALWRDPQCAHLKPHAVRALARELAPGLFAY
ncbi:MAG: hypothetical protein HY321_06085 [Armatimonadetes bacterium]|nr:hypothetical protein [Armatimonadota bacterium]